MITFKQQITVPEELVRALAVDLGWIPNLTKQTEIVDDETTTPSTTHFDTESYPNPVSAEQFIDEKSKENTINFFIPFGKKLVQIELEKLGFEEKIKQAQTQIEEQIITPIVERLVTEVVNSEVSQNDESVVK